MTVYELEVCPSQAWSIGSGPSAGNVVESELYVPGQSVLGSMAAAMIKANGREVVRTPEFETLFAGNVRFGPLYADGSGPVPMSVTWPKEGSLSDAIDLAFGGDGINGPAEAGKGQIVGVPWVEQTRVTLETSPGQRRPTAKEGELFSRRSIAPGRPFRGQIIGEHDYLAALVGTPFSMWFGGRKSIGGHGKATLRVVETPSFSHATGPLIVRLRSPAIFVDDFGAAQLAPSARDLLESTGDPNATVVRQWVRPIRVGGWHGPSGLPRPEELCVAPGSVYEISCAEPSEAADTIMAKGIGLRRSEGFGWPEVATKAWANPEQQVGADTTSVDAAALLDLFESVRAVFHSASDVGWLGQLIRDESEARAIGAKPGATRTSVEQLARFDSLSPSQRCCVQDVLSAKPEVSLQDLTILVRNLELRSK